ncbi:MAG: 50S ribosomal protein L19 [Candidatus Paceibacterota bacterium]|jgi:large subunit ribosomal protein L19|nr:50S ribosomal protein L19 [Candidatus Paceibacterota bacterium]
MAQIAKNFTSVKISERKKLDMRAGDTVRVFVKIKEIGKDKKDRTRLQAFEGLVLARKHGTEPGATFTVRKVTGGVGVERIFPLFSPVLDKIEIVRRTKTRRSKLYYIREKVAREVRRKMRNERMAGAIVPDEEEDVMDVEEREIADDAKAEEEGKVEEAKAEAEEKE